MADDIFSALGLSSFSGMGGDLLSVAVTGIIGLVIAVGFVALFFFFKKKKNYDQEITLWAVIDGGMRKLNKKPIPAKFTSEGITGDKTFDVKATKYNPAKVMKCPKHRIGTNEWYYFVTEENKEWINFKLGNLDKQLQEAGMHYSKEDMRLARVAIGRFLQFRLTKKEGLLGKILELAKQWAPYIIIAIGLVMVLDKMIEFQNTSANTAKQINENVAANCKPSGTTGVIPAPPTPPPPPPEPPPP